MKVRGKKFIALFLILSLIAINCATLKSLGQKRESRRKKHGANLIIQKINGQQVGGELITVKPSSLLLLNTEGKDASVDIEEIKVITIVKKSEALSLAGIGSLVGVGFGAFVGKMMGIETILWGDGDESGRGRSKVALGAVIGGCICALIGGLIGAAAGKDKTIQIEGMSDSEIQETLDKLRKKARIRDYK
jgi:hypothetical protein